MINFNDIKATEEKTASVNIVKPGFQTIKITAVEPITALSGSKGYNVTFQDTAGNSFRQGWYLVKADGQANIRVLESFQYLAQTFTGKLLEGEMNSQDIAAALVGTVADITVGGEKVTREKDGKKYNNVYPRIPFGGYSGDRNVQMTGSWDESPVESTSAPSDKFDADPNKGPDHLPF